MIAIAYIAFFILMWIIFKLFDLTDVQAALLAGAATVMCVALLLARSPIPAPPPDRHPAMPAGHPLAAGKGD